MASHTHLAVLSILGCFALASACSNDSSGPGNLPPCGTPGTQLTLAVADYTSIDPASDSGCVTFAANASTTDSAEYLVLPQSTGAGSGGVTLSAPFALQAAVPTATPQFSLRAASAPRLRSAYGTNAIAFDGFLRALARSRNYTLPAGSTALDGAARAQQSATGAPPTLGSLRTFKVCSNFSCSAFDRVGARVQAVGQHIAIYVDTLAPSPGLDTVDLDTLKDMFDARLYPLDTVTFGHVSDIDSNSVVIVLMTNTVNKLVTKAQCNSTGGFVAGFFFAGDLDPNFSTQFNNGEIFYSVVADPDSTLSCAHSAADIKVGTPVTFTHEFQHMINFVEHVLVRGGNQEDGWLDEGLSKYAEEIAGRSFLADGDTDQFSNFAINDVFDAYQYMLAPGSTPLIIPADTGTLPMIGASWLFVRYLVDQFGDSLPGRLVQTTATGTANVAGKTGTSFDVLINRWGLANWVSNLPNLATPPELQYTSWHFRTTTFKNLNTADPRDFPVPYPLQPTVSAGNAVNVSGTLWSGSGVYVRAMQPPGGAAFTLRFSGPNGAPVSSTVVPRLTVIRIR